MDALIFVFRLIAYSLGIIKGESPVYILLSLAIVFSTVFFCYWLLRRGHYSLSASLIPILVMLMIWTVLLIDKESTFVRLDTIVYIFIPLSMVPLLIGKRKYIILLFSAINILILIVFILVFRTEFGLNKHEIWDYIIDVSISFAIVGFVGYNINSINESALDRAEDENKKQKKAERELEKYRNHLEQLVKERTEELDTAYSKLTEINANLNKQKQELEKALTELKIAQTQLIQTEKMAALGILTAGVAHEINNPINYILNGTAAIEDYIKQKSSNEYTELRPYFDAINTGISRTTNIIKSLGRYSRSDRLPFTECNIHEIIEDCLTMLYNQYKSRIEIHREYYIGMPKLFLNEGKIHQALLNILDNAIQAIKDEGQIAVHTAIDNSYISIIISDTGQGISEESIKHIFDPFFTTKDPGQGTGLGLSITYQIIQEHNGTINCYSKVNEGTKFIITLPVKSAVWKK
jgi:signal transduction histidine kinase